MEGAMMMLEHAETVLKVLEHQTVTENTRIPSGQMERCRSTLHIKRRKELETDRSNLPSK